MLHKLSTLQDIQGLYDWFKVMRNTQPVWLDESSGCGCVSSIQIWQHAWLHRAPSTSLRCEMAYGETS